MDLLLRYGGDALWVIAMAMMATVSRTGFRRIPPGEATPAPWNFSGGAGPRSSRALALLFTPTAALLTGLGLMLVAADHGADAEGVLVFGARALLASLFALVHVTHVKGALAVLEAEGKLRP
jgi:hypothetical protein